VTGSGGRAGQDEGGGRDAAERGDGASADGRVPRLRPRSGESQLDRVGRCLVSVGASVEELERDGPPEVLREKDVFQLLWLGRLGEALCDATLGHHDPLCASTRSVHSSFFLFLLFGAAERAAGSTPP
jgi:hypothetical protein